MARGLFSGLVLGTVVVGAGLGGVSLLYPGRSDVVGDAPETVAEVAVAVAAETNAPEAGSTAPESSEASDEEMPAQAVMAEDAPTGTQAPDAPSEVADSEDLPDADSPTMAPEVSAEAADAPISAGAEDTPEMAEAGAAPEVQPQSDAPQVPLNEDTPAAMDQPVMPAAQEDAGDAVPAPEGGQQPDVAIGEADASPDGQAPGGASDASGEDMPASQDPPAALPVEQAEPETAPETAPEIAPEAEAEVAPEVEVAEEANNTPGEQAGQIGDMAENVTVGRLPSIGQDTGAGDGATTLVDPSFQAPARVRNAAAFENPENQPLMAVLLLDMGGDRGLLGDLKNLPFAMTFVVDASASDAAEAIGFYRGAGAEVVLSVPLPDGATPSDIEVTLSAYAPLLQDVVAVMAPKDVGFQSLGASAKQVAVVLSGSGHGLITIPQGLNTGHKTALKEGVAAGLIFRELDNDGQDARVIGRFMDNAAFKARQNDGVIMLGHARVETIQALIEWSLGNRAKSVALAPVSVVLAGE